MIDAHNATKDSDCKRAAPQVCTMLRDGGECCALCPRLDMIDVPAGDALPKEPR